MLNWVKVNDLFDKSETKHKSLHLPSEARPDQGGQSRAWLDDSLLSLLRAPGQGGRSSVWQAAITWKRIASQWAGWSCKSPCYPYSTLFRAWALTGEAICTGTSIQTILILCSQMVKQRPSTLSEQGRLSSASKCSWIPIFAESTSLLKALLLSSNFFYYFSLLHASLLPLSFCTSALVVGTHTCR